ncbi:MAG: hypothetical protein ACOYEL_03330 [Saccharofermentanales bacterium]|jgi:hypothetical protein
MRKLITTVLILALISLAACAKKTNPPDNLPSTSGSETSDVAGKTHPDTSPSASDSETPDVAATTEPPESEKTAPPTMPATEIFAYEAKEMRLKFEFPLTWKDKMQVQENSGLFRVNLPGQDYSVPEKEIHLVVKYIDDPWYFGDTFEKTTSEESIKAILNFSYPEDKIVDKSPVKIMDRDALLVTYSKVVSEGKVATKRCYLIDDDKGRCYAALFPIELEGSKGIDTFAGEAQQVVESMISSVLTDSTPITYEDKESGFTFEYPGNWHAYKNDMLWKITPSVHTYDFPFIYAGISLSYTPPGVYGNSLEEINWTPILETIVEASKPQVEPAKIGDAQALILRTEQKIPRNALTLVSTKVLIDAGKGSFYLFGYEYAKDNPAYEPFRAEAEKMIQTFRITNP